MKKDGGPLHEGGKGPPYEDRRQDQDRREKAQAPATNDVCGPSLAALNRKPVRRDAPARGTRRL